MAQDSRNIVVERQWLALVGALGGLTFWALVEPLREIGMNPRLYLALIALGAVYFSVALALSGAIRVRRALLGGALVAVPVAGLLSLAGLRFDLATDLLDEGLSLVVALVLTVVATPFLSVWLRDRGRVFDYAALFETSWTITVRYAAAWLFVGVFWAVLFLSHTLLSLVGLTIIEDLIEIEAVPFLLSGLVLGLGLAVVYELRDYMSPYLLLRLLRLLLPLVLVVVAVFIVALPFRGLSDLFGDFSAAQTLMAVALAAITLISTAVERDDSDAIATPGMQRAAQALALLVPVLAGLAFYAVALRVGQYGWTPNRLLAAMAAGVLVAYGGLYAGAVLLRAGWMARLRRANVIMAVVVLGAAIFWLTPVLNAQRIAAQSQLARVETGRAPFDTPALWDMAHEWGRPGDAALRTLEGMTHLPDHALLLERIAQARAQPNGYLFEQAVAEAKLPSQAAQFLAVLPVRPVGESLPEGAFDNRSAYELTRWRDGCGREMPDGTPGCVLVMAALDANSSDRQSILFFREPDGGTAVQFLSFRGDRLAAVRQPYDIGLGRWPNLPGTALEDALAGRIAVVPSGLSALQVGNSLLIPHN